MRPLRADGRVGVLVSVRSVAEAEAAALAGVDFIDLKDPRAGALGGLPVATIADIAASLRALGAARGLVSATIGDVPTADRAEVLARVDAVAACGVDIVKVGIERSAAAPALLDALAGSGRTVVPVFIADDGLDDDAVARAAALGFAGVMVDTADKAAGSLFDLLPGPALARFIAAVRAAGRPVGIAGALRLADWPRIAALAPDFAGFRSAVCDGWRGGALQADKVQALMAARDAAGAR